MSRRILPKDSTLAGLALAAVLALASCQTQTTTVSTATISGPVETVERFARLQADRTPSVETTPTRTTGPGLAEIDIVMSDTTTGDVVARVGQEAIAAGLSYSFTSAQTRSINLS